MSTHQPEVEVAEALEEEPDPETVQEEAGISQEKMKNPFVLPDDAVAGLGEKIYVINQPEQADQFFKTTEAILNYIRKTYKHGEDI